MKVNNFTLKNSALYILLILTALFLFLFTTKTTLAQSNLGTVIQISPKNVRAETPFTVLLSSSEIDLDRATMSWTLNEKLALTGIGEKGFSSKTGSVGTEFRVRVTILTITGKTLTRSLLVRPQEVDFLWRSFSYTPPFYIGRSLAPSSGFVSITAMPNMVDSNGDYLDPKDLVYTWSQRGVVLGSASGFGKQTIVLENGQLLERLLQLQVAVRSLNKIVEAKESIQIPLTDPKILFYERLPLEGIQYNKALRTITLKNEEIVVRAEPYFFSLDDIQNDKMLYNWKLNNKNLKQLSNEKSREIVFKKESVSGSANIFLEILNDNLPFRILQKASERLNIAIE